MTAAGASLKYLAYSQLLSMQFFVCIMVQLDIRDWRHIHNRDGRIVENELQMLMEDNKKLLDTVLASYKIEKELRELLDEAASVNQASQKQVQLITDAVEAMQSHMETT